MRFHLDFATLRDQLPAIAAKRVILTHMSRTCYRAIKPLLPAANWLRMGWSSTSLDAGCTENTDETHYAISLVVTSSFAV